MKTRPTKQFVYGLILSSAVLASAASPSFAQDNSQDTVQVVAPTTDSSLQPTPSSVPAAPGSTVRVLGTIPGEHQDITSTSTTTTVTMPAPMAQGAMQAALPPAPRPPADVPEVAPTAPGNTPWSEVLPPQKLGDITFVTGGIGDDERAALAQAKKEFNLYVMSANKDGSFAGDTQVVIRSAKGDTVLNTTAGPLLYVKLPAGTYSVEASQGSQTKKQKVNIGTKGAANINLSW